MTGVSVRRQFAGKALFHTVHVRLPRAGRIAGHNGFAPLCVRHPDHGHVNKLPCRPQDRLDLRGLDLFPPK